MLGFLENLRAFWQPQAFYTISIRLKACQEAPQGKLEGLFKSENTEQALQHAVKYLAGAYRPANGNHGRAVHYYAAGYHYAAKAKGVSVNSLAQANDTYAPATSRNVKFSSRQSLREAGRQTDGFGSSWNFYDRPDSY